MRDFPGDERTAGKVGGKEGLADAADRARAQHGANAVEHVGQGNAAAAGDLAEGVGNEPGDLILADREDAGVERFVVFDGQGGGRSGGGV